MEKGCSDEMNEPLSLGVSQAVPPCARDAREVE